MSLGLLGKGLADLTIFLPKALTLRGVSIGAFKQM